MIRINLLGVERQKPRRTAGIDIAQRLTLACSLVVVVAALGIGWWYWSLTRQSARVDAELAQAQQEAVRLRSLIAEVGQFQRRQAQLQQRVALIEQLRSGQSIPVQILDHVSRSLPDMLWLTELKQEDGEITIAGRSTTLVAVSDFVANLGSSEVLKKPIEIVNSQSESVAPAGGQGSGVELIRFTVKAQIAAPTNKAPAAAGALAAATTGTVP